MPIIDSDIAFRLSNSGASGGNLSAGTEATSLGKYLSTTVLANGTLNGLFDNISGSENLALQVDYRCVFVCNLHATLTLLEPILWIVTETPGGATTAIGVDPTAASPLADTAAQAVTIADSTSAPTGVAFSTPTSKSLGLALGDLPALHTRAFWVRRTAQSSQPIADDGLTVRVEGGTAA